MNKIGTNHRPKRLASLAYAAGLISLVLTIALGSTGGVALAAPLYATSPTLGVAESYSVLAHTTVTNSGPTTMTGDLGISIGGAPTGGPVVGPPGSIRTSGDATTAQGANLAAFNALSAPPNVDCLVDYGAVTKDLVGSSLVAGVYCADSFSLSGTLTLVDTTASDVWIFRTTSAAASLVTTPGSVAKVQFLNNVASACDVWWKVASSATIGSGTIFIGNVLALTSISMGTGASLTGRLLAQTGEVTLLSNTITTPICVGVPATITTTASGPVTVGSSITDTALLINGRGTPGGTISFNVYGPGDATCLAPIAVGGAVAVTGAGNYTSAAYATTSGGSYRWRAFYSGDFSNPAMSTACNDAGETSTVTAASPTAIPASLPGTGFAPGVKTILPEQPANKHYASLGDLWLEIPRLGVQMPIVGVPQSADGKWDVSWLGNDAGWLNGSAFPTWNGNSVITGHVWNADNTAGPFLYVNTLWWGDQIIVHAWGGQYVYEVRSVQQVSPGSTATMLKHEVLPWVTLVTCRGYDAANNSYKYRVLVRAVLVKTK
jgi:LPXTG-site transpeptidase (sortase) family protein